MSAVRSVELQVAALQELREASPEIQRESLRAALSNRNNYVVAKAADLVRELHLNALAPELATAYERFFRDAVKTDPQCWAKNALAHCMAALDLGSSELYLRGLHWHQMEPVWGGQADTAVSLRETCALALPACVELSDQKLLELVIDVLPENSGEGNAPVRIAIFRAMERIGSPSAALLLRMRASLGGDKAEVLGVCLSGVLSIEGPSAIDFVAGFLAPDDRGAEAALAISATHSVAAFHQLKKTLERTSDQWFCSVLLTAIALTRQESATEFLLDLIREESFHAERAVKAIAESAPPPECLRKVEEAIAGNSRLLRVLNESLGS